ncbi:MAG: DUF3618 domain-containing protein [Dermatophilaceae bacterium]
MTEPTSIAQLEADIAARRARLADTLNELNYRRQPKVIVERKKQAAQRRFSAATQNEYGDVRMEVVGPLVLAAVVLITWGVRRSGRR